MKSFLSVYGSPRMLFILLLGVFSGIPLALTGSTLQVWLVEANVDVKKIAAFSLVGIPYAWKIWAPLLDRYLPPVLGRRRGWLLISQFALACAIAVMAFSNPSTGLGPIVMIAVVVAFLSATQDIVMDAYKIEILKNDEQAAGASLSTMGYRIAMLISGAGILIMTSKEGWNLSWKTAYLVMAGIMALGCVTTLFAPEPPTTYQPKSLRDAVVIPFLDFFKRPGSLEIIVFITLYKLDVVVAQSLLSKFLLDLHFNKVDLATAYKIFGMIAIILGGLAGGYLYPILGAFRSLLFFGIFQGATTLLLAGLARIGHEHWMLYTAVAGENFASGMGSTAYAAFLALLCNRKFTATQYALLTSLMALTRTVGAAPAGIVASYFGVAPPMILVDAQQMIAHAWENYFYFSTLLAIPALLMLLRYRHWTLAPVEEDAI
jgi:PAT family beta-lactamase induction signal transducer AmpG